MEEHFWLDRILNRRLKESGQGDDTPGAPGAPPSKVGGNVTQGPPMSLSSLSAMFGK